MVTFSVIDRPKLSPSLPIPTSALTTELDVSTPNSLPANPIAPWKQAPYPTAKSCSGFAPPPGPPCSFGVRRSTSTILSSVAPWPSRPPVISALAVYAMLSGVFIYLLLFVEADFPLGRLRPEAATPSPALSFLLALSRVDYTATNISIVQTPDALSP